MDPDRNPADRAQLTMAELLDLGLTLSHPCLNAPLGPPVH